MASCEIDLDREFGRQESSSTAPEDLLQEGSINRQLSSASTRCPSENGDVCTICFETSRAIELPCSCTLSYCANCWERALSLSVKQCGKAQCPSCRTVFKLDVSAEDMKVLVSKQIGDNSVKDWKPQLYEKIKPGQIRLLQAYGAACKLADSSPENCDMAKHTLNDLIRPRSHPVCVCGSAFERISKHERITQLLKDKEPVWREWNAEETRRMEASLGLLVTCDLCTENAMRSGFVWSCQSGAHRLLHPTAYDVCEECFNRHTGLNTWGEPTKEHVPKASFCRGLKVTGAKPKTGSMSQHARRTVSGMIRALRSFSDGLQSNASIHSL